MAASIVRNLPAAGIPALMKPSLWRWLWRVILDWTIIVATYAAIVRYPHPLAYVLGMWILATRQHALSVLGHEGAHFALSRNHAINDYFTCVFAWWPLFSGLDGYRKFHFLHHATVGSEDDPELRHKQWAYPEWETPITRRRIAKYVVKDLLGFGARDIYRVTQIVKPVSKRDKLGPLAMWITALLVLNHFHALWMAGLWWGSTLSAYWAVFRLRMWTEHTGIAGTHRTSAGLLARAIFVPHNTWAHHEHHRWPSVPCWNLPKLRRLIDDETVVSIPHLFRSYQSAAPMRYGLPDVARKSPLKAATRS